MKINNTTAKPHVIIFLIIAAAAASALCIFLYHYDNKYTAPGAQPIAGSLFISDDELKQTPRRYLWNGWTFYPDVLLDPETYQERPVEKSISVQIGSYNNFAFGNSEKSPHGRGTYALTLFLPETPQTYAIELPIIYSSYKFYVGDDLVLSMGDIYKKRCSGSMQDRLVTFEASGTVRLILAVRDDAGIYSGMIYPPAFGKLLAVNTARAVRFMLSIAGAVTSALFGALSIWLAARSKKSSGTLLLFGLLCFSTALLISYPALHALLALPLQPLQTIELTNVYTLTLLIIILVNKLCSAPQPARTASASICLIMCMSALFYSAAAGMLTQHLAAAFSALAFIFRAAAAAYLLLIIILFYKNSRSDASVLLYAVIFYAVIFVWSCILTDYEPVMSAWFQEWGSIFLSSALGITLWLDIIRKYRSSLTAAEELRQMQRQLEMQQAHYAQIAEQIEQSRRQRHDFRHHLRTIASLSDDSSAQLEYIRQIADVDISQRMESYCTYPAVDALLYYYATAAKKHDTETSIKIEIPQDIKLPTVQLCAISGNLLENALEACQRQESGRRYISLRMKWQFSRIYIVVENSFSGSIQRHGSAFMSSKRCGEGNGTESVRNMAEALGGSAEFRYKDGRFTAIVIISAAPAQQ